MKGGEYEKKRITDGKDFFARFIKIKHTPVYFVPF